jgi:hypothetical protein
MVLPLTWWEITFGNFLPKIEGAMPSHPFSHILFCVTYVFCVTIYFSKKQNFLESLSHSLVAKNICKAFFINVTMMRKFEQILEFCRL